MLYMIKVKNKEVRTSSVDIFPDVCCWIYMHSAYKFSDSMNMNLE